MNHLRELLELHPSEWLVENGISDHDAYTIAGDFHRQAPSAMCFWMGDADDIDGLKAIKELSRLPFDCCWFEMQFSTKEEQWLMACLAMNYSRGTRLIGFSRCRGTWRLYYVADLDEFTAGKLMVLPAKESAAQMAATVRHAIAVFLTAMNCKNVSRVHVEPEPKLAKARAKRGKKPLFSYWTLVLNGRDDGVARGNGGTHASPRLHLRRGHPREYEPSKWTWVSPAIVGNKAAGMVHKDYSASPELLVTARPDETSI